MFPLDLYLSITSLPIESILSEIDKIPSLVFSSNFLSLELSMLVIELIEIFIDLTMPTVSSFSVLSKSAGNL